MSKELPALRLEDTNAARRDKAFASVTTVYGVKITPEDYTPDMKKVVEALARRNDDLRRRAQKLKDQNARLKHQLSHDPATGLPNQITLNENLEAIIAERQREVDPAKRTPCSVVFIDVNYFKSFNSRFGMDATDSIMKSVAQILQQNIHQNDAPRSASAASHEQRCSPRKTPDLLARTRRAGDEFVLVMKGAHAEKAKDRTKGILHTINQQKFLVEYTGRDLKPHYASVSNLSAARGVYEIDARVSPDADYDSVLDVLQKAESIMHKNKKTQKAKLQVSEPIIMDMGHEEFQSAKRDGGYVIVEAPAASCRSKRK